MDLIPQRVSLVKQTADILRREIARGRWRDCLPGQRPLGEALQVSRSTLEQALAILRRQGVIAVAHGKRTRVLARPKRRARGGAARLVVALTGEPVYALRQSTFYCLMQLQRHLEDAGLSLRVHYDRRTVVTGESRRLEGFLRETPAAAWVLFSMGRPVQQWFMDRGLPALLDGFAYEGIRLPSLDLAYEAIARHAAGRFLAAGHRRVTLLASASRKAGDLASERAFIRAVESSGYPEAQGRIREYDGTPDGAWRVLRAALDSDKAPTGLLVLHARTAVSVLGHLRTAGRRVPRDVAVIAAGHEEFLDCQVPSVACYRYDLPRYARRLLRLVLELARTGALPVRATRVMAEFQPGASFGPPG